MVNFWWLGIAVEIDENFLKGEVTAVHPKFRHFGPDSGGRYDAHKWSQIDFLSKYMIFEIF